MTDMLRFSWVDYIIFSFTLLMSAIIGIFWSVKTRRKIKLSAHHLLTGDRKLQVFPVSVSLSASFLSAVFIIGVPTEVYINGGIYVLIICSYIPTMLVASVVFVPIFHKLNYTSAYEYLERRFNRTIRNLGSMTFTVEMIIYLGVVMYTPSLALSQVTGLSMEVSILAVGLVCTFYTAIGGIKAVIWTDLFQLGIIVAGLIALIAQGVIDIGGWSELFSRAQTGKRLPWFNFNPDPFVRNTFWTLNVGGFFMFLSLFGANQATLQRYSNVKTLKGAQSALWLALPTSVLSLLLVVGLGLAIYAKYYNCDPFLSGRIAKLDQIVPLYMMETLGKVPGLPGLFVSCIFSASLSTVSSGVNSLAAVTICDFIKPSINYLFRVKPAPRAISTLSILVSIFYGLLTIALAYLAGVASATVLQIGLSVFGMLGGPLLGLFLLGTLLPFVNSWGAGAGLITSLVASLWLGIGAAVNPVRRGLVTLATDGCLATTTPNITVVITTALSNTTDTTTFSTVVQELSLLEKIYSLSYLHYSTVAVIVSVVVGVVVSLFTGCNKADTDPDLLFCWRDLCKKCWGPPLLAENTAFIETMPASHALSVMPREEKA